LLALETLTHENALLRRHAALRLALLADASNVSGVIALLDDSDPSVRAGAARALSELKKGARELSARLASEEDAQVRLEILSSLASFQMAEPQQVLLDIATSGKIHQLDDWGVDERAVAAGALMHLEDKAPVPALVQALEQLDEDAQPEVMYALGFLTNQSWTEVAKWQEWLRTNEKRSRDEWLVAGFQESGFSVSDLTKKSVWELCRAVSGPDHISVNAQRVLMRIAQTEVPSTTWSKYDASFYWRRWFERRIKPLGLPPIPQELSTAGGYVREEGG
jgi:HEAT repeat protein